jgi:glycosyltransferase involved in cell wall biosynthesis
MAWGLAIVTSSAGGSDEFLTADHNCLLVKAGDVQGIASTLAGLVRNPQLRQRLGTEARRTAECFSIDKYMAKLTCLYEELASHSPEPDRIQAEFTAD